MPKPEKTYDARLQVKLESKLKAAIERWAKDKGMSTNEAIRQAIRRVIACS